jgi:hypothetical protein
VSDALLRRRAAPRVKFALIAGATILACSGDHPPGSGPSVAAARPSPPKSPIELVPLPPDTAAAALKIYRLDKARLERWAKTQAALNRLSKEHPEIISRMERSAPPRSLDEMIARLAQDSAMRAVIKQSGSSPRDYVIAMVALQQALSGVQHTAGGQALPPDAPPALAANVQFVRDDLAIVQRMMGALPR